MNRGDFTAGRGRKPAVPDKVDMSLDDIIRLNKKEQQLKRRQATMNRRPVKKKGLLTQGKGVSSRTGGPVQRGGGVSRGGASKLRNRRVPPLPGRRRGQGVITGLAARRPAALLKRVGTLNRAAINQKMRQRTRPFIQRTETQYRKPEVQRRPYRQPDLQRTQNAPAVRRPFQLRRRPLPPVQQTQREARQATFLFRRGLKVQAQVQKPIPRAPPVRTRQWRTSTTNNGILTVSIDNPTARTQPEPPTAWTLHPPTASSASVKVETVEKKIPKGVPLQFDINSVGKPTSMTLNERFRILKDQRTATAQSGKGSRFVTVG
ncbi:UAP56-interacting factor-like isoform X2 [Thunnus albacares]|uniref:UAP56-interacting factor-like isoform X2 n=1 Tax=Thunnus maccoyii TaxID=8240 RepID=UPI001C4C908B|nr:UAP56-interacting factor-like isoform X2 [Thunnus maccoyii]XP_044225281.1 UAP56-interacting factor-like isoform X2 [Thunnus albacares]